MGDWMSNNGNQVEKRGQSSSLLGVNNNFNFEFLGLKYSFIFLRRYLADRCVHAYMHIYTQISVKVAESSEV